MPKILFFLYAIISIVFFDDFASGSIGVFDQAIVDFCCQAKGTVNNIRTKIDTTIQQNRAYAALNTSLTKGVQPIRLRLVLIGACFQGNRDP
jgi:hypothetical protein